MASLSGWVVESDVGKRKAMEDAYCHGAMRISCQTASEVALGGVFDGHGGDFVAKFVAKNMPAQICSTLQAGQQPAQASPEHAGPVSPSLAAAAIRKAFTSLDEELLRGKAAQLQGSTAVVAMVTQQYVHIGTCGDSRAVICQTDRVIQPIEDHCPHRKDEQARIKAAGGQVLYHNGCRVMGALAMSRAIGDHALRPYGVIADPDVGHHSRQAQDEFLVVASDGLWATVSNEDVLSIIQQSVAELIPLGLTRQQVTAVLPKMLTKVAASRGSTDNITVLILDLKRTSSSSSNSSNSAAKPSATATTISSSGSRDTSAAVDCIKRIISKAALAAWGDRLAETAQPAGSNAQPSKGMSRSRSASERTAVSSAAAGASAGALQQPHQQQQAISSDAATTAHQRQQEDTAAAAKAAPTSAAASAPASVPAQALGETVSVFVLAAAALAATQLPEDLEHASPFLNHQQSALSQVWRDWDCIKQTSSCCQCGGDSDCAPGDCSCRLPGDAAAGASHSSANPRKRRMITTELSSFPSGGRDLRCRATLSAPAQLQQQQQQASAMHALDAVLSGPACKKWQVAAGATAMKHQPALQALA